MTKNILFILVSVSLFSCDIKRKDKISDDSNLDSVQMVQKMKEDSVELAKKRVEDSAKMAEQKKAQDEAMKSTTTVQLIDSVYNFGTITDGEKVEYSYRFKNTGSNPLVIFEAHASCGCTVPEKPEKPILPGETGFLKVVFNSSGKKDHVEKEINVSSNVTPAFPVLKLMGDIKPKQ
ncbi:DUF1573 domain-containing protein [Ferruginibacter profundus]